MNPDRVRLLWLLAFALLGVACSMDMREMREQAAPPGAVASQDGAGSLPESAPVSQVRPQFLYSYADW